MSAYKAPKYPRILVSPKRHAALAKEAVKQGKSISAIAELKLK